MASLKSLKIKIQSYKKTGTVTKAMQAVSAVKMRKAQERALSGRAYAATSLSILQRLSGTSDVKRHSLLQKKTGKTCFVIITSDKGLAGSLNSAVIRKAEAEILRLNLNRGDIVIIAVGRRGGEYFASRGYDVRLKFENVADGVSEEEMRMITDEVLNWHEEGEISACVVAYTNFISTFEQEPVIRQIVPITAEMFALMVARIRPAKGKYSPVPQDEKAAGPSVYTIEPDADEVLRALLPKLLNIAVFHAHIESKASEHSARMVAMKSATDKAKEMASTYTRTFNKVRQAAITREVSEITSGIEAMK
ncbi:ATP synthase F1 subunit gamma [Candidatus Kaiserbacteria bacterium RIFCSPHIGHO2_02_FULL_49_16]|uniref:ATP synthase gamma chain n=1 Tax=Candidatus Kaiserbacteria bacterium RIFCSPHIGHO2_02_FULL_49_16 TaxID=1798490 RepID=A0A1F6DE45_9BACT|nr:MAG: ATP synthase F1 subunit gamma [Candidatus Kaiserbacteria bacterium RIFCSPHIGHO2_02_FULL_49_16]